MFSTVTFLPSLSELIVMTVKKSAFWSVKVIWKESMMEFSVTVIEVTLYLLSRGYFVVIVVMTVSVFLLTFFIS
jgi:hypothetical protein